MVLALFKENFIYKTSNGKDLTQAVQFADLCPSIMDQPTWNRKVFSLWDPIRHHVAGVFIVSLGKWDQMLYICNIDFSSAKNRGSENMVPSLKEPTWVLETCKQADKSHFTCRRNIVAVQLQPYGLQHTRLPCPSLSPGVCSNSCPLNWWCHPTISSSVTPFSSCHQSFSSIRVFSNESALLIRWSKYWSFSSSCPPNEYSGLIPWGLTGLISLLSKRLSRAFSSTTVKKY